MVDGNWMGSGVCRGLFVFSVIASRLGASFEQVEKAAVLEQKLFSAECQRSLACRRV